MNQKQLEKMKNGKGFIAALDQSGGSTPKALLRYGLDESNYKNDDEMFDLVHAMRTRIIKSPSFTNNTIIAAILFENTMDRKIDDKFTADYLWEEKHIVPILKVDKGLAPLEDGVQLMKPIPGLDETLARARDERNIFGTKMRSVIKEANAEGIKKIVDQQFEIGMQIAAADLVPILEPEVDINCPDKEQAEAILHDELMSHLAAIPEDTKLIFKLTIPSVDNLYADVIADPRVVRCVALSGGYTREESNEKLARNKGLIASFSRALVEGLNAQQTDEEFDALLLESAESVKAASMA
jgi:Fructose-1,6-bisphosphate aldolase